MSRKQKTRVKQQLSFWESFASSITNLNYKAVKSYYEIKEKIFQSKQDQENKRIIIQGKQYQNRSEAKKIVKNIVWFSYRKGFKISQNYKSDVGWGCLIRVGQMALASGLIRFFLSDSQINKILTFQSILDSIIIAFCDFEKKGQQRYSLTQIIKIAQRFGQKPGQWFDMTRISSCLQVAQNKHPMRGAQNLQVVFCDQSVNIPKLFRILKLKQCTCAKKNVICQKCHSQIRPNTNEQIATRNNTGQFQTFIFKPQMTEQPDMIKQQKIKVLEKTCNSNNYSSFSRQSSFNRLLQIFKNRRLKRDLLLLVLTRVGEHQNVEKVNQAVFSLLDLRICIGIMAGFPGKAIFVVGRQENKLIYLNPHYVQQNERIQSNNIQSYFCQQYLLTQRTQLNPTMNFCFYIQTVGDLQYLTSTISQVHHKFPDTLSIGFDFQNLFFDQKQYQEDLESSVDYRSGYNEDI